MHYLACNFLSKLHAVSYNTDMSGKTILVWFRNDLRVHDNEMLTKAIARADKVLPVYCFDPRYFGITEYGTQKSGYLRTQFLIESVASLKNVLQNLGGDLIIKVGKPEELLPALCQQYKISEVYHHREVAEEETSISGLVEARLWKERINLKHFIGHTLFHKEELPFPIKNIPDNFVIFKRKVDRESIVRPSFLSPESIQVPSDVDWGVLPLREELGVQRIETPEESHVFGGERAGLEALMKLCSLSSLKGDGETHGEISEPVLSPWLTLGCLSPRSVYWIVKERLPVKSERSTRIINELLWRDYNRFMLKKHGSLLESTESMLTSAELNRFNRWRQGNTGDLLVDACIRELNETGHINERCKLFLSSYLSSELKVRWTAGYAYFEEKAIDFSPALIWGNWAMLRGVFSYGKQEMQKFDDIMDDPRIKRRLEILHAG